MAPFNTLVLLLTSISLSSATKHQLKIKKPDRETGIDKCPSWEQLGSDIDGEARWDESGDSVSLSKNGLVVAIGATGVTGSKGHVRVYEWDYASKSWKQRGKDIEGEASCDSSGISVSMSDDGTVVAIGADENGEYYTGHVRVYKWNGNSWIKRGNDIDGEEVDSYSGISVAMSKSGAVVAIGADGYNANKGYVRIFKWHQGTRWEQVGESINGEAEGDRSGVSVSISSDGKVVAIGAFLNDGNGSGSGHVRVYYWSGLQSVWRRRGDDIDGEAEEDRSGRSVSMSSDGNIVAIGAYGAGNKSGHVRIYEWIGQEWNQRGADIDGEADGDNSGYSISLSDDGSIIAIGALHNHYRSGHVRVYQWDSTMMLWSKRGNDIDGEAPNDFSADSVSISNDGNIVAIGAPGNDGNGTNQSGHVRILKWKSCDDDVEKCSDSTLRFRVQKRSGDFIKQFCKWAKTPKKCALKGVSETCPSRCGTCSTCVDSPVKFNKGKGKFVSCVWVGKNPITSEKKCAIKGVSQTCRKTCGLC